MIVIASLFPLSLGLLVVLGFGITRVDELRVMFVDKTNESFGLQLLQGEAGQGTTDLQPFGHHRRSDQLVRGNFLVQFIVGS